MKLNNKNAIITGANRGLGKAIVTEFVKEGASVIICARNYEKLLEVKTELEKYAGKEKRIAIIQADVSKEESVAEILENVENLWKGKVDILVNNAGIHGPLGLIEEIDWGKWMEAININLIAPVMLMREIIPLMKKQNHGKIVNISGGGATSPMPNFSAYAATKAAIVRLTETFAMECRNFNVDINAVAPGAMNTRLLQEVIDAGPQKVGQAYYERSLQLNESGGASLENAAKLCVYLGSDKSNGITGKLISAVWDPWEDLEIHAETLAQKDIYTLRRIVPEDRGERW